MDWKEFLPRSSDSARKWLIQPFQTKNKDPLREERARNASQAKDYIRGYLLERKYIDPGREAHYHFQLHVVTEGASTLEDLKGLAPGIYYLTDLYMEELHNPDLRWPQYAIVSELLVEGNHLGDYQSYALKDVSERLTRFNTGILKVEIYDIPH